MTAATLQTRPNPSTTASGGGSEGSGPRYPLNVLRAFAALSVLTFHAYQHSRSGREGTWPWEGGMGHTIMLGTEAFVEMFFVLSGLVLWLPLARSILSPNPTWRSGRSMLMRRLARLLPLYYTVVITVWAITNPGLPGHWKDLLLHLSFTHVYSDEYIFWTDGPAWSLAVEMHFYLLVALAFPLLQRAARRLPGRGQRIALLLALPAVLMAITLVNNIVTIELMDPEETNWSVWFSPISRAGSFALGMTLAVVAASGVRLGAFARRSIAVVGFALLALLIVSREWVDRDTTHWWVIMYAAVMTLLVVPIVLHDGPWARALEWKKVAWLGTLGYGIYLLHEPVMRFMTFIGLMPDPRPGDSFLIGAVVVAIPSIALAWLSSRTVEAAGLRLVEATRRDGTPKDYYPHLTEQERQAADRAPQPV